MLTVGRRISIGNGGNTTSQICFQHEICVSSVIRSNSASVCFKAIAQAREGRVIKWRDLRPCFFTRSFESFRTRRPGGGHLWADSGHGNLLRSHNRNDATCLALADSPPPTTVRFSSCRGIRLSTVVEFRQISRTNLHMNMGRLPWQRRYHHLCLDVPLCEQVILAAL